MLADTRTIAMTYQWMLMARLPSIIGVLWLEIAMNVQYLNQRLNDLNRFLQSQQRYGLKINSTSHSQARGLA